MDSRDSRRGFFVLGLSLICISAVSLIAVWKRFLQLRQEVSDTDLCYELRGGERSSTLSGFGLLEIVYEVIVALLPTALAADVWHNLNNILYGGLGSDERFGLKTWAIAACCVSLVMTVVWVELALLTSCMACCLRSPNVQIATAWAAVGAFPYVALILLLGWKGARWFTRFAYSSLVHI